MMSWQDFSDKFLTITPREQYLIILTGLAVIFFCLYTLVLEGQLISLSKTQQKNSTLQSEINTLTQRASIFNAALLEDPNIGLKNEVSQYQTKISAIDSELLTLTSGLIDPVQMRHALLDLLNVNKGVSLQSFELLGVEEISTSASDNTENTASIELSSPAIEPMNLYKHAIKLKLKGGYFQIEKYLRQLESSKWRFFWTQFNYNLLAYPNGELEVTMYSLSTQKEFIGV